MNSNSDSGYLRDYLDFDIDIRQGEPEGYAVAVKRESSACCLDTFGLDNREYNLGWERYMDRDLFV